MNSDTSAGNGLREMEPEVEVEGREWMRRRLEEKLQAQAEKDGAIFPQNGRKAHHRKKERMQLRTSFGTWR
jgi:uncharacterized protein YdaU (DUF1376 family)